MPQNRVEIPINLTGDAISTSQEISSALTALAETAQQSANNLRDSFNEPLATDTTQQSISSLEQAFLDLAEQGQESLRQLDSNASSLAFVDALTSAAHQISNSFDDIEHQATSLADRIESELADVEISDDFREESERAVSHLRSIGLQASTASHRISSSFRSLNFGADVAGEASQGEAALESLQESGEAAAEQLSTSFSKVAGVLAGVVGVAAVTEVLHQAEELSREQTKALTLASQAAVAAGRDVDALIPKIKTAAKELQLTAGINETSLLQVSKFFAGSETLSDSEVISAISLVGDAALRAGGEIEEIGKQLQQALTLNVTSIFDDLGIDLVNIQFEALTASEKLDLLEKSISGAAKAQFEAAGGTEKSAAAMRTFLAELGKVVTLFADPIFESISDDLEAVADHLHNLAESGELTEFISNFKTSFDTLLSIVMTSSKSVISALSLVGPTALNVLNTLIQAYDNLPEVLKSVGIISAVLFGPKAALVFNGLGLLTQAIDKISFALAGVAKNEVSLQKVLTTSDAAVERIIAKSRLERGVSDEVTKAYLRQLEAKKKKQEILELEQRKVATLADLEKQLLSQTLSAHKRHFLETQKLIVSQAHSLEDLANLQSSTEKILDDEQKKLAVSLASTTNLYKEQKDTFMKTSEEIQAFVTAVTELINTDDDLKNIFAVDDINTFKAAITESQILLKTHAISITEYNSRVSSAYSQTLSSLQQSLNETQSMIDSAEADYRASLTQIESLTASHTAFANQLIDQTLTTEEVIARKRKEAAQLILDAQKAELDGETALADAKYANAQQIIRSLAATVDSEEQVAEKRQQAIEAYANGDKEALKSFTEYMESRQKAVDLNKQLIAEDQQATDDRIRLQKELGAEASKTIQELGSQKQTLLEEIGSAESRLKRLQLALEQTVTDTLESTAASFTQIGSELKDLEKIIPELDIDTSDITTKLDQIAAKIKSLNGSTIKIKQEIHTSTVERKSSGGIIGMSSFPNRSGFLPGYGGGDKIKALLEAGEFIFNKKAVKALGVANLQALNNGATLEDLLLRHYQSGGVVEPLSETIRLQFQVGDQAAINTEVSSSSTAELRQLAKLLKRQKLVRS